MRNLVHINIILIILASLNLSANDSNNSFKRYGVYAGYGLVRGNSAFSAFQGIPNCCPEFKRTDGYQAFFGGIYDYSFGEYGIEGRLGGEIYSGSFKHKEPRIFGINGTPTPGNFEHHIDFDIYSINFDALFRMNFLKNFGISAGIGTNFNFSGNFIQFESVSSSAGRVTFADAEGNSTGSSVRNQFEGEIPELSKVQFSIPVNIYYEFNLKKDRSLILRPEAGFRYTFKETVMNTDWKYYAARIGVSLIFSNKSFEVIEEPEISDTDLLMLELEEIRLREEKQKLRQAELEAELLKKQLEAESLAREIKLRDSINEASAKKMELLREEFDMQIKEENQKYGEICKCYIVQFISTSNRSEAVKVKNYITNAGYTNIIMTEYKEPYMGEIFYRITSDCFDNHLEAFDYNAKIMQSDLILNSRIICNR
ncbi:MAG: hypothetical protein KIT33_08115 [Candidatus Kapabacteria bacterium]|nr:hypothetical protein [Ignavibacteriota bacterium]MCW5884918.1 hypothetical protein [Candidatus Kapabacteria bacterium]